MAMKRVCDICDKYNIEIKQITSTTGRISDAAGSRDDEQDSIDLCVDHLVVMLNKALKRLQMKDRCDIYNEMRQIKNKKNQ